MQDITAQTTSQRVAAYRRRLIDAGAQRLPTGILPPDAAQALDHLVASGYAPSRVAAISRALVEAQKRNK